MLCWLQLLMCSPIQERSTRSTRSTGAMLRKGPFAELVEAKTLHPRALVMMSDGTDGAHPLDATQKAPPAPAGRAVGRGAGGGAGLGERARTFPRGILVTSKSATTLSPSSIYSNRWKACGCYAHLASPELRDAEKRVADIRQMMKDKNDRQFSGNLYHAYRKMAHYSDAVDPHSKCVNPRHLARYLGELGVTATEQEACRLLNRTVSAANLRRPFSIATFYTVATGGIPSDSSGRASRTSGSSGFTGFPRKAGEECRE
ncbi:unnamed protein product, partial [Durusdinium trenchii]